MDAKEVRMRCIEALSAMGVRETSRLTRDAEQLEEWVNAVEDKVTPPKRASKAKTADKE
jgi:hypothetical protein